MSASLQLVVWTVAVLHATAAVVAGVLAGWANERGGPKMLAAAGGGWLYLLVWSRELRNRMPAPTRPSSLLRFIAGVVRLEAYAWLFSRVFSRRTRRLQQRATHPRGAAATGLATVALDPDLPAHAFFAEGHMLHAVLRHANAACDDDAALDQRGAALRLFNPQTQERLDLLMNTGRGAPFWDTASLFRFLIAHAKGELGRQRWIESSERVRALAVDALVRAPSSYSDLDYYSAMVSRYRGRDGIERLCRYRLMPGSVHGGSQALSEKDLRTPWLQERCPTESRALDYLRRAMKERLAHGHVLYNLQIQVREVRADDRAEIFDASIPWPDRKFPWRALAAIEISECLTDEDAESLAFNVAHAPASLGLFAAGSPQDPNAIGWYRRAVYSAVQGVRHAETSSPLNPSPSAAASVR